MVTNRDATLYHRIRDNKEDSWQRVYLPEVWWYENAKAGLTTNGLKRSNTEAAGLTARIPNTSIAVRKGDYIVKGACDININTVKDLKADRYCITGVNYNTFGMNPHIKVVGV